MSTVRRGGWREGEEKGEIDGWERIGRNDGRRKEGKVSIKE